MAGGPVQSQSVTVSTADPIETAITEREIIQAVGRGRGVNRHATRPLNVFVLADAALPTPVTKVIRWTDNTARRCQADGGAARRPLERDGRGQGVSRPIRDT